jgi:hypothetical protein
MEVGDFTAVSISRERISPSRCAKISFMTVLLTDEGLHSQPQILRWVPPRSIFRTHKGWQYPLPSHDYSASVRRR